MERGVGGRCEFKLSTGGLADTGNCTGVIGRAGATGVNVDAGETGNGVGVCCCSCRCGCVGSVVVVVTTACDGGLCPPLRQSSFV